MATVTSRVILKRYNHQQPSHRSVERRIAPGTTSRPSCGASGSNSRVPGDCRWAVEVEEFQMLRACRNLLSSRQPAIWRIERPIERPGERVRAAIDKRKARRSRRLRRRRSDDIGAGSCVTSTAPRLPPEAGKVERSNLLRPRRFNSAASYRTKVEPPRRSPRRTRLVGGTSRNRRAITQLYGGEIPRSGRSAAVAIVGGRGVPPILQGEPSR